MMKMVIVFQGQELFKVSRVTGGSQSSKAYVDLSCSRMTGDDGFSGTTMADGWSGTSGLTDPGAEVGMDGCSWMAGGARSSRNGAGGIDSCFLGSMMEAVNSKDCSSMLLLRSYCKRASENKSLGLRGLSNQIGWYTKENPSGYALSRTRFYFSYQ